MASSVHTHLMFQNGKAEEALRRYEEVFAGDVTISRRFGWVADRFGVPWQLNLR